MALKGTYKDFLAKLLAFESGIDPRKFSWYVDNQHSPIINYVQVDHPGRISRSYETGSVQYKEMTVLEYFRCLGVDGLFNACQPKCLKLMQYNAINPLGFIGYQLGESILISTGYYLPQQRKIKEKNTGSYYETYYWGGVPDDEWKMGIKEKLYKISDVGKIILITDVNCWQGNFTGKHGIRCLSDLKIPANQETMIREIMYYNYNTLNRILNSNDISLNMLINNEKHTFKERLKNIAFPYSLSGILAAAHLGGAWGVAKFLKNNEDTKDELGTPLQKYLMDFSDYEVPFNR